MRAVALMTFIFVFTAGLQAVAAEAPKLVEKDGRFALMVDGKPFLVLGGQIHNSSAWPSELPQIWQSFAALHANTLVAPVYWEQMESRQGHFDFANVDQIVQGARQHNLHVILLWFGTWKNGNMHYVPSWVKNDPLRYPHTVRPDGEPIDVLSPMSRNTLGADKTAFVALLHHLKEVDGEKHTILMVQVENESGNIGSIRDNSAEANAVFAGAVPADLLAATHKKPDPQGNSWRQVFGGDADEIFQLYHQAKYIDAIAAAGKREFAIPLYINVWISYPAGELPQRQLATPGIGYPSGGAVQKYVGLWRALAPSIDVIAPDIYSDDLGLVKDTFATYRRPDNPLMIAEIARDDNYGKFFYSALGAGAIGFSPFGVDLSGWNIKGDQPWKAHANNYALIAPMSSEIARLEFEGKLKTAVEQPGQTETEIDFGGWQATVAFGFPQADGRHAPGNKDANGAALIAQLGPDEFLVTGVNASVTFHLPGKLPWIRSQILTAEQGTYDNGIWKPLRLWNGDETDRGLQFHDGQPQVVRAIMNRF
jgi:beta-galactosidase GanA